MTPDNAVTPDPHAPTSSVRHPCSFTDADHELLLAEADDLVRRLELGQLAAARIAADVLVIAAALDALVDALAGPGPRVGHDRARDEDALVPGHLEPAAPQDRDTPVTGSCWTHQHGSYDVCFVCGAPLMRHARVSPGHDFVCNASWSGR